MNRLLRAAAVAAMIVFAPMCGAQVLAGGLMTSESHAVLTLLSVDPLSHTAVLGGGDGWSLTVDMPADADRMQRAKPGALFRLRVVESLGLQVEKGGTAGTFEDQTVALAPPGAVAVGDTFSLIRIEAITLEMLPDQIQTYVRAVVSSSKAQRTW